MDISVQRKNNSNFVNTVECELSRLETKMNMSDQSKNNSNFFNNQIV